MNDLDLCLEVVQGHVNHCGVNIYTKLLELETSNLIHVYVWECRAGAQIIFPESGCGLASRSVQWGTRRWQTFSLGAVHGADRRSLGDE